MNKPHKMIDLDPLSRNNPLDLSFYTSSSLRYNPMRLDLNKLNISNVTQKITFANELIFLNKMVVVYEENDANLAFKINSETKYKKSKLKGCSNS